MRMRASLRERRRQVIYVVPNLFTTGNLFCGLYAIIAVFGANYVKAAVAILVALIFDMLDGSSARWTKTTSQFGIEYDSLADLVSFGVAPGVLIYSWALSGYGFLGQAVAPTSRRRARFSRASACRYSSKRSQPPRTIWMSAKPYGCSRTTSRSMSSARRWACDCAGGSASAIRSGAIWPTATAETKT